MGIVEQLVDIYYRLEGWHKTRMNLDEAYKYHADRLVDGRIYTVIRNNEVLGYYEREFNGTKCFLKNIFVMPGFDRGFVFRELKSHFFSTMPDSINEIYGDKVKDNGKKHNVFITRRVSCGNY